MGLWSNTNAFAGLSGNQPASKLDTNFGELAIMSAYATAVGGTANDIALTASLTLASGLQAGVRIAFIAGATNTGAMTASVNGSANPAIQKGTLAVGPGDVKVGGFYELYHDGAVWQLQAATQTEYLISTTSITALTATVDSPPLTSAFGVYRWLLTDVVLTNATADLLVRLSRSATYAAGASDYQWSMARIATGAVSSDGSAATSSISVARNISVAAGDAVQGQVWLFNPSSAVVKTVEFSTNHKSSGGDYRNDKGGGYAQMTTSGLPTTAVDGLRFLPSAGTLTSGRITMYGVRNV